MTAMDSLPTDVTKLTTAIRSYLTRNAKVLHDAKGTRANRPRDIGSSVRAPSWMD